MWREVVAVCLVGAVAGFGQNDRTMTVAEAQQRLLQLAGPEIDADVPPAAQAEIRELKAALGRETDEVMGALSRDAGAAEAQRRIVSEMP